VLTLPAEIRTIAMRHLLLFAGILAALFILSACGTKGPLTLPAPNTTAAKSAPADNSKPAEAPR
jgi:predicted small lipoprotein YifL